jgi:hypothetical protein
VTPAIVLARSGVARRPTAADLETLRRSWHAQQYVRLPQFLDRELLAFVRGFVNERRFAEFTHPASGHEQRLEDNPAIALLDFLMNDRRVMDAVEQITSTPQLGMFHGRIYQLTPGTDEGHDWHADHTSGREIGVSINLTDRPFEGGVLQLRWTATGAPISEYANVGAGDCVLFRLADEIEHRVLPVTGTVPRVAYAGWFYSGRSLKERLADLVAP